jgi:hypothetical protein
VRPHDQWLKALESQLERDAADMRRTADTILQHRFPREHAEMVRDLEHLRGEDGVILIPGLLGDADATA